MKRNLFAMLGAAAFTAAAEVITLNGAGASFPAPVYQNWSSAYTQSVPGVAVNYRSMGSGAGVAQIKAGTVDFSGTDKPLAPDELKAAGLEQFPMLAGGVVPIVNLPGVRPGTLKLDRAVLSGIFLGDIRRWNAPEIAALNPGVKLPKLRITVVRRADASGTTFLFTDALAKFSKKWRGQVGSGASVRWPIGIGGQKNPGVCNTVARIRGAIGYTEYTYAVEARLAMPQLQNRDGKFISPTPDSFRTAAEGVAWNPADGFRADLNDRAGENAWPITGVTYVLIRRDAEPATRNALNRYFRWCFDSGASAARRLHYVPMPEHVAETVKKEILK